MKPVDIYIRKSSMTERLEKIATLTQENQAIYRDESHLKTAFKFTLLTAASPLFSIAHLVRSTVFVYSGEFSRAGREFVGALSTPLVLGGGLGGTLLSGLVYLITAGNLSFHINMRRTYASFEAWVNDIDTENLVSYSQRVSTPFQVLKGRVWTTAPCMQPLLENGDSRYGGLLDPARMQKIFPFILVNGVANEDGKIVIQSEFEDRCVHYSGCNGWIEHSRRSETFCCCYRVEAAYDRVLCCEVGSGSCTSIVDSGDSCGISSCAICGIGACCCYVKEKNELVAVNTGCFGPLGLGYVTGFERRAETL